MSYQDFSSWPRDQEQTFVVYEQRTKESSAKALTIGSIVGAIVFVIAIGIYAGVTPEESHLDKDFNMDNLTKGREQKAATPAPAPKAEAPKAEAPKSDAPKADSKEAAPAEKAPAEKAPDSK
jgi:hypothetical protein